MLKSITYSLKQAFTQTGRNKPMMITSLFSITAMLLILGMFFILVVNINMMTESAKDRFDMVEIYLLDEATDEQIKEMRTGLEELSFVDSVVYVSKDDAMREMERRWGDNAYLLQGLTNNPLPRSLQVTMKRVEDSQALVDFAGYYTSCVEDIKYNKNEVEKILKITDGVQIGAMVVIIFLIVVSVVVVSNTIKLTVLARGQEISIMKYVGATNWFIRGPFLTEGIIIGVAAALLSSALITALYFMLTQSINEKVLVMFSTSLVPVSFLAGNLIIIFIALGVSIGAMGSIISMRRFLDT